MGNNIIVKGSKQPQVIRVDGLVPVQEIKMEVTELNRGPQGLQGPPGENGRDGAIQYTAGFGININSSNVISATGTTTAAWGTITGTMSQQADLNSALTNLQTAVDSKATASAVGNINDLTTTAKTNTVAAINEVNSKARFDLDYSSTEMDTGATWVDGSKIYKKTVYLGLLPNASNKTVAHNIANLDKVVKIEAIIHNGGTYAMIPFVHTQAVTGNININVNTTDITISTGNDRSSWSGDCTIYYTKTS